MFEYSLNGVSLSLIRDVRGKEINSTCPLKWRVTYNRKQKYYNFNVYLDAKDWELLQDNSRKPAIKDIRDSLQTYFVNVIQKHIKELAENDKFSFELLNVKLKGAVVGTVNDAFNQKIKELENNGNLGNASIYQGVLNSIEVYAGEKIKFEQITIKWLKDFQTFQEKKNISYATMAMRFRTLRAIYNDAIRNDLIKQTSYPFGKGKFEIKSGAGRNMALEIKDINKIAKYQCKSKTLEMCRDMFLFSFYCNGANIGDICRFQYKNIENGEIYFYRKKTINTTNEKKEIIAPILKPMQNIIDKWGNTKESDKDLIFPFCSKCTNEEQYKHEINNVTRLINKQIKVITKALNLPDISTYNARHSYATILAKKRVPESYISEQLGHANRNVTQNYFDKYTKQERIKYNSMLLK